MFASTGDLRISVLLRVLQVRKKLWVFVIAASNITTYSIINKIPDLEYKPCGCVKTCENYRSSFDSCQNSPVEGCFCPNNEVSLLSYISGTDKSLIDF